MVKIDKKILFFAFLMFVGYYLFSWYELRPAKIKHDCSWIRVTDPAVQAVSKEEADASKAEYDKCMEKIKNLKPGMEDWNMFNEYDCKQKLKKETEYIPEKTRYRKATDKEYDFCVHNKGL